MEVVGEQYYNFRKVLMERRDQGLTKTYNRFHNPDERDSDIVHLRDLHAAMDRALLDAYGWTDPNPLATSSSITKRKNRKVAFRVGAKSPGAIAGPTGPSARSEPEACCAGRTLLSRRNHRSVGTLRLPGRQHSGKDCETLFK